MVLEVPKLKKKKKGFFLTECTWTTDITMIIIIIIIILQTEKNRRKGIEQHKSPAPYPVTLLFCKEHSCHRVDRTVLVSIQPLWYEILHYRSTVH